MMHLSFQYLVLNRKEPNPSSKMRIMLDKGNRASLTDWFHVGNAQPGQPQERDSSLGLLNSPVNGVGQSALKWAAHTAKPQKL